MARRMLTRRDCLRVGKSHSYIGIPGGRDRPFRSFLGMVPVLAIPRVGESCMSNISRKIVGPGGVFWGYQNRRPVHAMHDTMLR